LHWRSIVLGGWGVFMILCLPAMARTTHDGHGGNCVAFARDVTGIHLDGNAASWWPHAEGRYERGQQPRAGSILVFRPYGRMHVGHVAVVSQVVGPREILVDQANWVRGRVSRAMAVFDASPHNDWTTVRVQFGGNWGTRENPTFGFIYPRVLQASFGEKIVEPQHDSHRAADRAKQHDEKPQHEAKRDDGTKRHATADARHKHKKPDTALAFVY
jgi:surface antigen